MRCHRKPSHVDQHEGKMLGTEHQQGYTKIPFDPFERHLASSFLLSKQIDIFQSYPNHPAKSLISM